MVKEDNWHLISKVWKDKFSPLYRICFFLLAIIFWSNNVVMPFCEYLKIDSIELAKDFEDKKTEKEQKESDTDQFLSFFGDMAFSRNEKLLHGQCNYNFGNNLSVDVLTPPPRRG